MKTFGNKLIRLAYQRKGDGKNQLELMYNIENALPGFYTTHMLFTDRLGQAFFEHTVIYRLTSEKSAAFDAEMRNKFISKLKNQNLEGKGLKVSNMVKEKDDFYDYERYRNNLVKYLNNSYTGEIKNL